MVRMATQATDSSNALRTLMARGIVVAPGAFDAFSALLIKDARFNAVYVGGAWVTAAAFGRPDVGWMALPELVEIVRRIADVTRLPVIVDADSGYGDLIGIYRTVRDLHAAGAAALHIEDIRESPPGDEFYSVPEMRGRIRAALDARIDDALIVIARTDTRGKRGLSEAIDRACAYCEAGAELLFVNWPESEEEIERIGRDVPCPLLLQISEGARTPQISLAKLEKFGVRLLVYPGGALRAAGAAMSRYISAVGAEAARPDMLPYEARSLLTELSFFEEWQSRHES
jgi:2-methylisocitrate lyase-like PEP mutase family enzyme